MHTVLISIGVLTKALSGAPLVTPGHLQAPSKLAS